MIMHCKSPCLDVPLGYSSAANGMIFSKAQWDKDREMACATRRARAVSRGVFTP
jgi:hypothetical protein